MNLLCPNCQKMLTVPDQYAGQQMKCPMCAGMFTAPVLPKAPGSAALAPAPAPALPSPPVPPPIVPSATASPSAATVPAGTLAAPPDPFAFGAPSAPPTFQPFGSDDFVPPKLEDDSLLGTSAGQPTTPAGYSHTVRWHLSSSKAELVAPIALSLVFLLMFFTWVGTYPGGYAVYTQSGWQALAGSISTDPVGDEILERKKMVADQTGFGVLMFFYFLLLLLALALTFAGLILPRIKQQLPPPIQQLLPWRPTLAGAVVLGGFLLLVLQLVLGFGLESAVQTVADDFVKKERERASTPEKEKKVEIERGRYLGGFNLERTLWLRLVILCHFAAVLGVGVALWGQKRGATPPPRLELNW